MNGRCVDNDLVYSSQLALTQSWEVREYLGSTRYKNRTNLAKTKWSLREKNMEFIQTWKIECYAQSYTPDIGYCNLCATKKYLIVKNFRDRKLLNDRSEIISTCRH